jgi:hypothetical protein
VAQNGGRELSSPNASSLFFCEFSFLKVLVIAKRRLQDAECKKILEKL